MCEPMHSIVQIPDDQSQGLNLGKLGRWCKKIGGLFHLSKMGKGHYDTMLSISYAKRGLVYHGKFDYEVQWWDRSIQPDFCHPSDKQKSCALQYANSTSIGSLHSLRQFLKSSLELTISPSQYIDRVRRFLLNKKGGKILETKLRRLNYYQRDSRHTVDNNVISAILGMTRKRNLLVPEWSDDNKLWIPGR